jgi:large subunit ribosomal protein L10
MKKEEKEKIVDALAEQLSAYKNFYITDTSSLTVETTNRLRRLCFNRGVKMQVAKNTLIYKALEKTGENYENLSDVLKGSSTILFAEGGNVPAKLIKEFRKKSDKPILKGAFIESSVYIGDDQLDALANLKTKNELVADIIALLQSPAKNVISALQSGGNKLAGIVKTLSERSE